MTRLSKYLVKTIHTLSIFVTGLISLKVLVGFVLAECNIGRRYGDFDVEREAKLYC